MKGVYIKGCYLSSYSSVGINWWYYCYWVNSTTVLLVISGAPSGMKQCCCCYFNQGSQMKSLHKERLLTSPHEHTERLLTCLGRAVEVSEFQTFCESRSHCFTSGDCPNSTSLGRVHRRTYSDCCMFPLGSRYLPVCMWGFAHVCSLRNAVLFFSRHLWLFFEVFSQTPFLPPHCYEKPNTSCFLAYIEKPWFVCLSRLCATQS